MSIRDSVPEIVRANTEIVNLLGDGLSSIYPRVDEPQEVPPGKPPFILWKRGVDFLSESLITTTPFEWWIYDDPGYGYNRIDAIEAALIAAYDPDNTPWYSDPSGDGWRQEYAGGSEDLSDDNWHLHLRIARWQLWRAL